MEKQGTEFAFTWMTGARFKTPKAIYVVYRLIFKTRKDAREYCWIQGIPYDLIEVYRKGKREG